MAPAPLAIVAVAAVVAVPAALLVLLALLLVALALLVVVALVLVALVVLLLWTCKWFGPSRLSFLSSAATQWRLAKHFEIVA